MYIWRTRINYMRSSFPTHAILIKLIHFKMSKLVYFLSSFLVVSFSFGQTILYQETFENTPNWSSFADNTPNAWIVGNCAGNGSTTPGQNAMYISYGGTNPGCGPGGIANFGFLNSDNGGSKHAIYAKLINATCASNLQISFERILTVDGVDDYADLVYSTDNGVTWNAVGGHITNSTLWQTVSVSLPASLNFSSFLLGFRFTYNETVISAQPLAVDNITITGTDSQAPVVTCPPNQTVYVTSSCSATVGDYINLATATDNCVASSSLTFTQNPLPGTVISSNTAIQITAVDLNSNAGSCNFTLLAIDTIMPVIACIESMDLSMNPANCSFTVPNMASTLTITDNCTTTGNFIITQNPLAGSTTVGITDVIISVTDQGGNTAICSTRLFPIDTVAPVVVCPPNVTVNNGTSCDYTILNYNAAVTVTESCPFYSLFQDPPAGVNIGTGEQIVTFTATDQMGNNASCTFTVTVIENILPTITFCPNSIATCDPVVTFADITATDNCGVLVTQTDLSGLSSGSTFPVGVTPLQFTATDSAGNTAVCNFNVEIYAFPSIAEVVEDTISLCEVTTCTLEAIAATSGTGAWTQILGTGTIANSSNPTTTVTNLASGLNTFVWSVSTANCGTFRDTVFVTVYQQPTVATTQADTIYSCSALSTLLLGSFPTSGTSTWTTLQGANITSPNNHNTVANQLAGGWNDFVYTISSGACGSNDDTLSVYFNNQAMILSEDTTLCSDIAYYAVTGSEPAFGQSDAWYYLVGDGNILTPTATTTEIQNMSVGTNKIVYRLSHPVCGFSHDTITIVVQSCSGDEFIFPTVITPNLDGKNDLFVVENLNEAYPNCEVRIVNRWGSTVYESTGYETPWNGTHKGEDLPMGTYYYNIQLNDSEKTVYSGPISIIR
ncbi:MAG: HYR domain-containing protein [Crocinitomicaceae bacterium]|nr:MAG: HYR domain-containing protein [Crocinitomicaceae bacterium]